MRGDKLPSCEDDPPGGVLLLVACFLQEKFSGGRLKPHVSGRRLQHSELPCVMLWDQRPRGGDLSVLQVWTLNIPSLNDPIYRKIFQK